MVEISGGFSMVAVVVLSDTNKYESAELEWLRAFCWDGSRG